MPEDFALVALTPQEYVRTVLPLTHGLWGYGRTPDEYVADFLEMTASAYGRRRFGTIGLRIGGATVASCKRYERELRTGTQRLRAVGIGAVFTPPRLRGRGYASALIGALLDAERAAGTDAAYLFSNIHPHFYERLGFVALPSRTISLRAASLDSRKVEIAALAASDWTGVRRCFEALEAQRPCGLRRTPLVWDRLQARRRERGAASVDLTVKRGRTVIAYALGRRDVRADAYVLEELGFADERGRDAIGPLLRSAAGDLRKVVGWLPPDVARDALPHGAVRARREAIAMVTPLSAPARARWRASAAAIAADRADRVWSTDAI